MPYVEFGRIEDVGDLSLIPDGQYIVRVERIDERQTQTGEEMWHVRLRIVGQRDRASEHAGRSIFDNWVFSEKALPRFKLISASFGLDIRTDREVEVRDFTGKEAEVEIRTRRYTHDGDDRLENYIPFAGYLPRGRTQRSENPF